MDIQKIIKPFQHFGVRLGLERMYKLLDALGNPHQQVPIIHVAGTNGKGSVCAYLSAVLTQAGYRVGRYTSPHLVDWTERICIQEQPVDSEKLQQLLLQVIDRIKPGEESPTEFEVLTAAAWLYFAQEKCDIAVMEVGLGGRLDATNVCDRPLVTIITSISRDHWQVLGSTLADIAREKAGILKARCRAVIGKLPPGAMAVVKKRIAELDCRAIYPENAVYLEPGWAAYRGMKYPLPLLGDMQLGNSAQAIACLEILSEQGWEISAEAISQGMAKTSWPGRIQWTTWRNHPILIDGAHNGAAAAALRQYVDNLDSQAVNWVIGMLCTKDHEEIFTALLRPGDKLYLVPVPDPRSADPQALASLAQSICTKLASCQACKDLKAGMEAAVKDSENLTVLSGSLYLVGNFLGSSK